MQQQIIEGMKVSEQTTRKLIASGLKYNGLLGRIDYEMKPGDKVESLGEAQAFSGEFSEVKRATIQICHKVICEQYTHIVL